MSPLPSAFDLSFLLSFFVPRKRDGLSERDAGEVQTMAMSQIVVDLENKQIGTSHVQVTYIIYQRGRGGNCVQLRNLVQRYVCTSYVGYVPEGNVPHRYRR